MIAVKWTCALALTLGSLGVGCGSDSANNDGYPDASASVVDDAGAGDAGDAGDASFPCTSYTPAKLPSLCGGSHCQQSPEKMRTDTPTTAKCGSDAEVASYCSLKPVDTIGLCVVTAMGNAEGTRQCATPLLPELSAPCLDCFLDSTSCAVANCFTECLARESRACDECRVRKGCIDSFYNCAGFVNPLPPEWQMLAP